MFTNKSQRVAICVFILITFSVSHFLSFLNRQVDNVSLSICKAKCFLLKWGLIPFG